MRAVDAPLHPTRPLERIAMHAPDPARFDAIRAAQRPVILEGVMSQWRARAWTLEGLRSSHGQTVIPVMVNVPSSGTPDTRAVADHQRRLALGDFIDEIISDRGLQPCYANKLPLSALPGLRGDIGFDSFIHDDTKQEEAWTPSLWLSSGGVITGLHFDYQDNVLCQLQGDKRVYLISPEDNPRVYPSKLHLSRSRIDPEQPDLERFRRFGSATVYETMLSPGEILFIPRFWWHHVRSLGPSVSVNYWFGALPGLADYVKIVNAYGPGYWLEIARQVVVHGMLGRAPSQRLYCPPTNGEMVYGMLFNRAARENSVGGTKRS